MNRPDLYNKTVNILFDAYFNDTLKHGNCYACAVGNIIAANRGYKIMTAENMFGWPSSLHWEGFTPYTSVEENPIRPQWYNLISPNDKWQLAVAEAEIASTGYNLEEIKKIEEAFETSKALYKNSTWFEDRMFNGLVAVLEVLKEIHEVEDNEEEVQRFREHYSLKTSKI